MGLKPRKKSMTLEEYFEKKAELTKFLQNNAKTVVRPFFEKLLTVVKAVCWTQYTPYFNDGDACEFGVNEPYFAVTDEQLEKVQDGDFDEYEDLVEGVYTLRRETNYDKSPNPNYNPLLADRLEAVLKNWGAMEEIFEEAFGDHVRVIATLNNKGEVEFQVEEYEHD